MYLSAHALQANPKTQVPIIFFQPLHQSHYNPSKKPPFGRAEFTNAISFSI
jgi:hypothetical protein